MKRPIRGWRFLPTWLFLPLILVAVTLGLPIGAAFPAQAASVPVTYDATSNTIVVGENYSDPNLAAYPSAPNAPKTAITIPQVAAALTIPGLLINQGSNTWLLKANLEVRATARLEATSASLARLRLESAASFVTVYAEGGHLLFQNIAITSWNTAAGTVDTNYADGRAYLVAHDGGRMDIVGSEIAYLGWANGEPSGISWHSRATAARAETGATGSITGSNIHHNYFGQYSYEAYGLIAKNSQFHDNVVYGFDPHDYSTKFEVAYNKVYNNGKHGIIFSRGCEDNWIHDNEVYGNAEHGIMLDRGSNNNRISNNLVYGNADGLAIFQSSDNLIEQNTLRENERGARINSTYDVTDEFDGISTDNTLRNNTIADNSQYGVYLYERADRNTLEANQISGNTSAGVYIKTGGNQVLRNTIVGNGIGVSIFGGSLSPFPPGGPTPVPALEQPGHSNSIAGNTIEDNDASGIQIKTGVGTTIGGLQPGEGNRIKTNGTYGITLNTATTDSQIAGNTIQANGVDGVLVKGADSLRNQITRNSISANAGQGIKLSEGANGGIAAPAVTSAPNATTVTGTAPTNATIEVYRDINGQGRVYKGQTTAAANGNWSFALPVGDDPAQGGITALAIVANGNTSSFGGNLLGGTRATYEIGAGRNGELTIFIGGPSANLTLPDIQQAVKTISPTVTLLENQGDGVWQANASLFFNRGVTLTLTLDTVKWLKLRSQATNIQPSATVTPNYQSFVALRTYNGAILIDGVRITSWDPQKNDYDRDISNGRGYLLAKYDARMDIKNADLSYLGSPDGESYGVAWRDINDADEPDVLRTRVTGTVLNSTFSYNYYGIYTFQASNMVFRNNTFHHNISYGFDPHDFSHHFTIEDNEAYANGNHGFIISRGCNNFVFRRNKSYDNRYTVGEEDRKAHGFMLDPGSPNSRYPQAPSHDNLLENNAAWNNDGYGLRIVNSNDNIIRNNSFRDNLQGITVEQGGTGNTIGGNTISGSQLYGVYLFGGADGNTISGNIISGSGKHGVYVKTGGNTISDNTISRNGSTLVGSGIAFLRETTLAAAAEDLRLPNAGISLAVGDPSLLGSPEQASEVAGNIISGNTIADNADDGIELKNALDTTIRSNTVRANRASGIYIAVGSRGSLIENNTIARNLDYGIKANGADVVENTWNANSVFANGSGGIVTTGSANGDIAPPTITGRQGLQVSGTATPGALVRIFSDTAQQGQFYEGSTTAGPDGSFTLSIAGAWHAPNLNATATDAAGNSSALTYNSKTILPRLYLPLART